MVAGLMFGFASKSKSVEPLVPGEPGCLDPPDRAAPGPVVALGEQQLGQESVIGELFLLSDGHHVGDQATDGRQP